MDLEREEKPPKAPKSTKEDRKSAAKPKAKDSGLQPEFEYEFVKLSGKKWASHSRFKGKEYVNIREYYEKD